MNGDDRLSLIAKVTKSQEGLKGKVWAYEIRQRHWVVERCLPEWAVQKASLWKSHSEAQSSWYTYISKADTLILHIPEPKP